MIGKIIFIAFLLVTINLFCQDTAVSWLRCIDTLSYKMKYSKRSIPKELLKYIEVEKLKEIANPNERFISGCVGTADVPHMRLNWVAKDKNNHVVTSISFGGKAHRTCYFYLDKENKKTNINELWFGHLSRTWSFGTITTKIKNKEFEFMDYEEPEPREE